MTFWGLSLPCIEMLGHPLLGLERHTTQSNDLGYSVQDNFWSRWISESFDHNFWYAASKLFSVFSLNIAALLGMIDQTIFALHCLFTWILCLNDFHLSWLSTCVLCLNDFRVNYLIIAEKHCSLIWEGILFIYCVVIIQMILKCLTCVIIWLNNLHFVQLSYKLGLGLGLCQKVIFFLSWDFLFL